MDNGLYQKNIKKFYKDAITLRKYDDEGKIHNIKMKKIDDYRDLIASQLID